MPAFEERGADPRVEPDAVHHDVDVGVQPVAQAGYLVRERDLRGEESVRGVLDELRARDAALEDRRIDAPVERGDPVHCASSAT